MLPTWHDENICLAMKIDMSWSYYPDEEHLNSPDVKASGLSHDDLTKSFKKELLLLFHRPMNYTKVLCRDITNEQHLYFDKDEMEMEQLSDHDSCWRSDGMKWIFQTFVEAWDYFDKFQIDGRKIEPYFHYSMFKGAPAYYHLEKLDRIKKDDEDRWAEWNSPYMVKIGKQIPMNEISKYMKGD
jgi:hypothetical protein